MGRVSRRVWKTKLFIMSICSLKLKATTSLKQSPPEANKLLTIVRNSGYSFLSLLATSNEEDNRYRWMLSKESNRTLVKNDRSQAACFLFPPSLVLANYIY